MTMLEKIAEVISQGVSPEVDKPSLDIARDVLVAIRKPTKEMEAAAEEHDDWGVPSDPGSGNASALTHWVAMIDEALKD